MSSAAAIAAGGRQSDSALAQLELLQLLVQQSAAWQAIQLLGRQAAARCGGQGPIQTLQLPLSGSLSSVTTRTACRVADDASSQCCESRHRRKRAARGTDPDEEEVSSGRAARRLCRQRVGAEAQE